MWVKDQEASDVIARALEAGYFDEVRKDTWQASTREKVRRMARELLDDPTVKVRIFLKAFDRYPETEGTLTGDLDRLKENSDLDHIIVERKATK